MALSYVVLCLGRMSTRSDRDFGDEVEAHIRLEADRLIADGMAPEEAEACARRTFGNVGMVRERFYESRRWLWWDQLYQDVRYGLRWFLKAPAFTAAVALTIALGVGANTAIFSLMDAVLLRSLPVGDPKKLVFIEVSGTAGNSGAPPYPCFTRLRNETDSFSGIAGFSSDELRIEIDGKPEQVMGQVASGNYFELLRVRPALGRLMDAEDEKLNPPVAVISDRYWRRRFAGDAAAIGTTISFHGQTFTIAGVTPPEFWGLEPGRPIDITIPISTERQLTADSGAWWFSAIARLKPGRTEKPALAESDGVFQSFMKDSRQPADMIRQYFNHLELRPAAHGSDSLRRQFSKPLYALMSIAGLVLLMATVNIANLLLARGIARSREFAIRLATGAGRLRLVRQLVTETLLLFVLGAAPSVLLASWGAGVIQAQFAQGRRAITLETELNWRVLGFTLAITMAAGVAAALFPAWRAFRTDADQAIRDGHARTGESRGSTLLTRGLVAVQVAISLVLLVGAVTFVRTLRNLRHVDPGFHNEQVLTMSVELPEGYERTGKPVEFWSHALEAVRGIGGVGSAGFAVFTPLSGRDRGRFVKVRGYQPADSRDSLIHVDQVSEGYFETLGIRLLRGRLLDERDASETPHVAVISEFTARKYFGNRDPIGEALDFSEKGSHDGVYRIVGVVADTKHMDLREPPKPFAYVGFRQTKERESRLTLAVASARSNGEMALVQPIREAIRKIEPGVLISEVITVRRQLDSTLLTERLLSGLASAFGGLALMLASIGLYGVLSYRVGQQRRSIGIRMALGAPASRVALGVVRQSAMMVGVGLACGIPFAFLAARAAESMLWGLTPGDPWIYVAGVAMLCGAGLASTYWPARRAAGVDPAEALRQQ